MTLKLDLGDGFLGSRKAIKNCQGEEEGLTDMPIPYVILYMLKVHGSVGWLQFHPYWQGFQ